MRAAALMTVDASTEVDCGAGTGGTVSLRCKSTAGAEPARGHHFVACGAHFFARLPASAGIPAFDPSARRGCKGGRLQYEDLGR
jgi:hypothetical protein